VDWFPAAVGVTDLTSACCINRCTIHNLRRLSQQELSIGPARYRPVVPTWIVLLGCLLATATAAAQPVGYRIVGDVRVGDRPSITITAARDLGDLAIDLTGDRGQRVVSRRAALARGQTWKVPIGDGAAGRVTYKGTLTAQAADLPAWTVELAFDTLVRAPIKIGYDAAHLDLAKRTLQFTLSRKAGTASITALGEDGAVLGAGRASYAGDPPGTWLSIQWTQPEHARVLMLKLDAVAADGLAASVELVPWSVEVAHEDVGFPTDSAVIEPAEATKLDASLAKIREIVGRTEKVVKLKLYVAGHTDTVGPAAKNRGLSLARARAIAGYFRARGLALPIAVAGFGEEVLRVATPDNTDERANRRADYVIGPVSGQPPFTGPYLRARAAWAPL
jgi:outer membrane protein OmpA-like peptidoglycan-associated protein